MVGAITTMGVIGDRHPMFMGAMMVGPLGGWAIKRFDKAMEGRVKSGFEMLVNNFLRRHHRHVCSPFSPSSSSVPRQGALRRAGERCRLPGGQPHAALTSIFVEPAKILFLNNAINHGIFSPLGISKLPNRAAPSFFLIEANPGPGMGVLLAYMVFGRGAKQSAAGASIIHFFGGIHEIYFPYVLMNPRLILAVIAGGMTGSSP